MMTYFRLHISSKSALVAPNFQSKSFEEKFFFLLHSIQTQCVSNQREFNLAEKLLHLHEYKFYKFETPRIAKHRPFTILQ